MVPCDGYCRAMVFFTALQWLTALGRCAIRIFIVRKFGLDDIAMLLTLLLASAYDGCWFAVQVLSNNAQPIWNIDVDNLFPATNTLLALLVVYILATMMLKVALGLLLLRVLVKRWQVITIFVCMGITVLYSIMYFFFVLFECGAPSDFAIEIIAGRCMSIATINGLSYTHGVLIALVDCVFAVLPIALIAHTDMSKRSKISVALILALGSVGCIATFVRLGWIHDLSAATWVFFQTAKPIGVLSGAELSIGIACLSLACYKPLFHRFFWTRPTYYYGAQADNGQAWHSAQRQSGQPLQHVTSATHTVSTLSPSPSRNGIPMHHARRTSSNVDQDWPMKTPKYSVEDAESAPMSPVSPVKF